MREFFTAEGLDVEPRMLAIARERNRGVPFHRGNMLTFRFRRKFDVITCLFSAVGYLKSVKQLRQVVNNMAHHLNPGGVLIVEPWITPGDFRNGRVDAVFINRQKLKLARINIRKRKGRTSVLDFHYLVGTPEKIEYFREHDEFGLFTHDQYMKTFRATGMKVVHDSKGLIGRGLYIGIKPLTRTRSE
jgi:SAM-dependent methyltransferase